MSRLPANRAATENPSREASPDAPLMLTRRGAASNIFTARTSRFSRFASHQNSPMVSPAVAVTKRAIVRIGMLELTKRTEPSHIPKLHPAGWKEYGSPLLVQLIATNPGRVSFGGVQP